MPILSVKDIDFENGFINIVHQIVHDKDGYYITPPKTENNIRKDSHVGFCAYSLKRRDTEKKEHTK